MCLQCNSGYRVHAAQTLCIDFISICISISSFVGLPLVCWYTPPQVNGPDGALADVLQETSEEVRLQVVKMIGGPVLERCGPVLSQHAAALASILQQALADPFHEIKKVTSFRAQPDQQRGHHVQAPKAAPSEPMFNGPAVVLSSTTLQRTSPCGI